MLRPFALILALASCPSSASLAEDTALAFAGLRAGAGKPVEINAASLSVDQAAGNATFQGEVVVTQGDLKLTSDSLLVEYAKGDNRVIDHLMATGHVALTTPAETAKADSARYSLADQTLEMTGNVLLTQGGNQMTGQKLLVDMKTGTGRMDGRVKTILQPADN